MQRHKIPLTPHLLAGLLCLLLTFPLAAQQATQQPQIAGTGSRLSGSAIPRQVLQLSPPSEIRAIRKLLAQDNANEAHRLATEYLARVELSRLDAISHYYAYNALCAVETHRGQLEAALAACNTAIDIFPGVWSALNNRGTVKLLDEDYPGALTDYRQALERVAEQSGTAEIIRHNIAIAESRNTQVME